MQHFYLLNLKSDTFILLGLFFRLLSNLSFSIDWRRDLESFHRLPQLFLWHFIYSPIHFQEKRTEVMRYKSPPQWIETFWRLLWPTHGLHQYKARLKPAVQNTKKLELSGQTAAVASTVNHRISLNQLTSTVYCASWLRNVIAYNLVLISISAALWQIVRLIALSYY